MYLVQRVHIYTVRNLCMSLLLRIAKADVVESSPGQASSHTDACVSHDRSGRSIPSGLFESVSFHLASLPGKAIYQGTLLYRLGSIMELS